MKKDSIVDEVRAARAAIAAEFRYDLPRYLAWAREQTRLRQEALAEQGGTRTTKGPAMPGKRKGSRAGVRASG